MTQNIKRDENLYRILEPVNYFQEEETYLFSSLLGRLQALSKDKDVSLMTKCFLAIFWKIRGEEKFFKPLLEEIEKEIDRYDSYPEKESNRTKKVFTCAVYKAITKKVKYNEKIQNYLIYARDSKDWLGQPRVACCLSFLANDLAEDAKGYIRENFGKWLSEERDDFITIGLLALKAEITIGELQRILEHVEPKISDLPINLISLYLIGISHISLDLPSKNAVEYKLYQVLRDQLKATPSLEDFDDEVVVSAAMALSLSNYHKICGYFKKYASDLKETLTLKNTFIDEKKKARVRNLLLCITSITSIFLICSMFFISALVEFKENPSMLWRLFLFLIEYKGWALAASITLILYILISYLKRDDPVFGIVEYIKEKAPILKNIKKEEK